MGKTPSSMADNLEWEFLGQCLENTPLVGVYLSEAENAYNKTLEKEPDGFLFHGAQNEDQAKTRFSWLKEDIDNLSQRFDISGKSVIVFEDEYENIGQEFDGLTEEYGLNIVKDNSNPYPGSEDWLPVMQTDWQNIRSYTSRSNRDKLEKVGEDLMPERNVTVFGIPDESDSDLRFYLGKLDYHLRQKRATQEYME